MFGDISIKAKEFNKEINNYHNNPFYYLYTPKDIDEINYDEYYDFTKDFEFSELYLNK